MKKSLSKFAVDFFQKSYDRTMSSLVFFDDEISPHIDHKFFNEYLEAWFSTLICEYEKLNENIKTSIDLEIDNNCYDIFAGHCSA